MAGLDDKASAPRQPATKVTLRAIATVQELQRNPRLGGFRIAAALRQQGIILSPRTCRRILAKNRALYGVPREEREPREPKPLPFAATRPHEYWCLDIRYLDHGLGPGKIYCLSVMDSYSRAFLASMLARSQDLVPVLLVLYAAMRAHGIPGSLVTDSGGEPGIWPPTLDWRRCCHGPTGVTRLAHRRDGGYPGSGRDNLQP